MPDEQSLKRDRARNQLYQTVFWLVSAAFVATAVATGNMLIFLLFIGGPGLLVAFFTAMGISDWVHPSPPSQNTERRPENLPPKLDRLAQLARKSLRTCQHTEHRPEDLRRGFCSVCNGTIPHSP